MPINYEPVYGEVNHNALWRYVPNEEIDFSRCSTVNTLYIYASRPVSFIQDEDQPEPEPEPYILPSIAHLFPVLRLLRIGELSMSSSDGFIGGLTDIPSTVINVGIANTHITDLSTILRDGTSILYLSIKNNLTPISFSRPLPPVLIELFMENTFVSDSPIVFPSTIRQVAFKHCRLPRIYGLDRADPNFYMVMSGCITQYQAMIGSTQEIVEHITQVNAQRVYLELGSIPKRIKISEDKFEDPIVVVMKALQSNYPRRMAEFMAVTDVSTTFIDWDEVEDEEEEEEWFGEMLDEVDDMDGYMG